MKHLVITVLNRTAYVIMYVVTYILGVIYFSIRDLTKGIIKIATGGKNA